MEWYYIVGVALAVLAGGAYLVWRFLMKRPTTLDTRHERVVQSLVKLMKDDRQQSDYLVARALVRAGLVWETDLQTVGVKQPAAPSGNGRPPQREQRQPRDQRSRDQSSREQGSREQGSREQGGRDQGSRDQRSRQDQRDGSDSQQQSQKQQQQQKQQRQTAAADESGDGSSRTPRRRRRRRPSGSRPQQSQDGSSGQRQPQEQKN